jgi:carbon monoxide dehydrogenase subunit G
MVEVFAVEATIDRPIEEVWSRLTDWPRADDWMPGVASVRADGESALGTTLTVHVRGRDRTSRITAFEPGRAVTLTCVQGGVRADYAYACAPSGAGTRVTLRAHCQISGVWKVAGGLIRWAIRRADSGQLEALKRVVEAGARNA